MTWGKLSFWLLPNLTEDVSFFDSFRPVYQCTVAQSERSDGDAAAGSCDADKNSATAENIGGEEEKSGDHLEELEGDVDDNEEDEDDENNAAEDDIGDDDAENSSDDDIDKDEEQSVAGNDNGYEMISAEDIENGDQGDIAAEDDKDADGEESRPTVRRRKGKRRIT